MNNNINYVHALIIIFIPLLCPQQEISTLQQNLTVKEPCFQVLRSAIQMNGFIVFISATITALGGCQIAN